MGRRTIAGHKLTFNKRGKPEEMASPANLSGERLQDLFFNWAMAKKDAGVLAVRGQSFLRVVDVERFNDNIVVAKTMSGKAGEEGIVYDVESGRSILTLSENDVPTSSARAILLCPPRGEMALWFSEYSARSSGASLLLDLFKKDWNSFGTGFTFNKNRLIASEIALDEGVVTEVEVRLSRRSDDRSVGIDGRVGTVSHRFKPSKGGALPGRVIDVFRTNPAKAYELVEISSPEQTEDSRIYVSVNVDGHSRKVEIFNPDDGIYFREELNPSGAPVLSDLEIIAYCSEEAATFFTRAGGEWDESWSRRR